VGMLPDVLIAVDHSTRRLDLDQWGRGRRLSFFVGTPFN
jgi:hypothetical protein